MNNATEQDIIGVISAKNDLRGSISNDQEISGAVATAYTVGAAAFDGDYEITPTRETQIIKTAQTVLKRNIIVNPIPSNYGKITWDGGVLTVS